MPKHQLVGQLVEKVYLTSQDSFAQWIWLNHVPIVAKNAELLAETFNASTDLAVAGAWLHDFGDAFVNRFSDDHDEVTRLEATKILQQVEYSEAEIAVILDEVIAPHSCKDGVLPTTLEGKILATADAMAHLQTDFYLQLAWNHIPEGKSYSEFRIWAGQKIERDYTNKIFFEDVSKAVKKRYEALQLLF